MLLNTPLTLPLLGENFFWNIKKDYHFTQD